MVGLPEGDNTMISKKEYDEGSDVLKGLKEAFDRENEKMERDAVTFHEANEDICMMCGAQGADKRNLRISMFYAVHEVVPEMLNLSKVEGERPGTYYMRICKKCRADLLGHLQAWRNERIAHRGTRMDHDGNPEEDFEYGKIYVRINGVSVPMSEDEYWEWRKLKDGGVESL
jgi:hypothetical protein